MMRRRSPSSSARRRRDLDDLLEAALDAAFALAQMRDGAGAVAEDLHLDVAGAGQELLDVDVAAAERGLGLGPAALVGRPRSSSADVTARVPRPPPPASALMIIAPPAERGEERLAPHRG